MCYTLAYTELTCQDQTRERHQRHSRTLALHRIPDSYLCRTWGTPARPGDSIETPAASRQRRVCRSRRCARAVPTWAPWRCQTHRCVPPTVTRQAPGCHSTTQLSQFSVCQTGLACFRNQWLAVQTVLAETGVCQIYQNILKRSNITNSLTFYRRDSKGTLFVKYSARINVSIRSLVKITFTLVCCDHYFQLRQLL